ncbi:20122_t:CDS:1 [Cetraspora pellucida]|uniref:20122_t:CDS:1 n=1 Tax=Cetraspora pellucida TaxID=1433469 RepID=A0A9N8W6J7_9GLOM|nr:20122_t:CDS:1 [Cetraspora pellucida]
MSRLAKRVITIPPTVEISLSSQKVLVRGPAGKNELLLHPEIEVIREAEKIWVKSPNLALTGTFNSLIYNLIWGVDKGYRMSLEVKGVGYKVSLRNGELELSVGKSHLDYVSIPCELQVELKSNRIIITGSDKQRVFEFANHIRVLRPPSIYKKNKGIYFLGEEKNLKLRSGKTLRK